MSFSNKVVLVTGGCSGIGEATAIAFVKEGATVVIIDKDETKGKEIAEKCEKLGLKPTLFYADLTDDAKVRATAEAIIDLHKHLDVLVNCAGILKEGKLLEEDFISKFDDVMNINLRGLAFVTHLMAPHLIKTKGNVINVASAAATSLPRAPFLAYSVSKAGVHHFSKAAARELGPFGVRVNSVNPGYVRTSIYENAGVTMDYEKASYQTSLGRVSEPSEIADMIVYLASEKAKSVTGSNILIDCGVSLLR